ncbi:MAG: DUF805 domain-containing protein [Parcubacteria group bacterium CG10_big_fil_rev_8_21_14_0_10_38_31]|nr:MAG: DUF805 domain-containing protein [Parcubacteria group bacterium CG10_big_fil_rev_8_21_14_0_10_38_31]
MFDYYIGVLKKYAVFTGRARRAEYWYFLLTNFLVFIGLGIVNAIVDNKLSFFGIFYIRILYSLAIFIPSLAVGVRRLHDTGRSGWWLLISLIPLIGTIWLFILLVLDSNPGDNKYGPNPKGVVLKEPTTV